MDWYIDYQRQKIKRIVFIYVNRLEDQHQELCPIPGLADSSVYFFGHVATV
jgi:hypothetical protein